MTQTENTTELLAELRGIKDERDTLNQELSKLAERESRIERELLAFHEATGLSSLSGGGLSVSFDPDALRAKYDPDQWSGIVRWAVEHGHDYIVQRRLSDAKIVELAAGGTELPAGLTLESYTKLSIRRKS